MMIHSVNVFHVLASASKSYFHSTEIASTDVEGSKQQDHLVFTLVLSLLIA